MAEVQAAIDRVRGFRAAGVHAGLKKTDALDMTLIVADRHCAGAGVFTTNRVKAAPVLWTQECLRSHASSIRAVVINTASANACTGDEGMHNARRMADMVAEQMNCQPQQVLVMSTGVIGTQLPMEKIGRGIELAVTKLGNHWLDAARGIMTTDTKPKIASVEVMTADGAYTIAGISKGSGMIAPNMATMLGIIVTDARLDVQQASAVLKAATDRSYNRIVVDGDTSTNDMVTLLASGASGVTLKTAADLRQFEEALTRLCVHLARQVVRDGEGASKFITLDIRGAVNIEAANAIGRTIAASALVKTAFYGNDANWGRIIAAAGRAGVAFNPERARLWFAPGETLPEEGKGLLLFEGGMPAKYAEEDASRIIQEQSVYVTLDCGQGDGVATFWTCDLSHEYVSINAEYRS